jgi:hypothetical protein
MNGVAHGGYRARKVRHTAARELGVVGGNFVDVPKQIQPLVAVLWRDLFERSGERFRRDQLALQLGS